jgi:prolipoprotein diacylglyceryl transferase
MFSFFGVTFHAYGLIVGMAIVISIKLIEIKNKCFSKKKDLLQFDQSLSEQEIWFLTLLVMVSGVVGARIWHVVTDWQLYQSALLEVFFLWQGGLSIIGAAAGGMLGLIVAVRLKFIKLEKLWLFLDLAVFGIPFGQAIGRLGNYVNQELYGLPSKLPWAIEIEPQFRIAGYEQFSTYHPLFLYEGLLTLGFGVAVWWLVKKSKFTKKIKLGTGKLFLIYVLYYSLIRLLLDFLRVDKSMFLNTGIGVNQLVLIVLLVAIWGWNVFYRNT